MPFIPCTSGTVAVYRLENREHDVMLPVEAWSSDRAEALVADRAGHLVRASTYTVKDGSPGQFAGLEARSQVVTPSQAWEIEGSYKTKDGKAVSYVMPIVAFAVLPGGAGYPLVATEDGDLQRPSTGTIRPVGGWAPETEPEAEHPTTP